MPFNLIDSHVSRWLRIEWYSLAYYAMILWMKYHFQDMKSCQSDSCQSCFQCRNFDCCKNSCTGNLTAAKLTNFLRQLSTLTTVTLRSCQWTPAILYGKVNLETYIYNMYNEGHGVVGLICFLFCCCAVTHSSKSSFHSILHKKFR